MNKKQPIPGFFYSGFLTQTGDRRVEPVESYPEDKWGAAVTAFAGKYAKMQRVHWKSVRFREILPTPEQLNARKMGMLGFLPHAVDAWKRAVGEADREAAALVKFLDERVDQPYLLVGHSLGARIILQAAMRTKHRHAHVVALAPALAVKEFDMAALSSPHRDIDVFFSSTDLVLSVAFPVGQSATLENGAHDVIGHHGPPGGVIVPERIHFHDTNKVLKREEFGHTDYAEATPSLSAHSRAIRSIKRASGSRLSRLWGALM